MQILERIKPTPQTDIHGIRAPLPKYQKDANTSWTHRIPTDHARGHPEVTNSIMGAISQMELRLPVPPDRSPSSTSQNQTRMRLNQFRRRPVSAPAGKA